MLDLECILFTDRVLCLESAVGAQGYGKVALVQITLCYMHRVQRQFKCPHNQEGCKNSEDQESESVSI